METGNWEDFTGKYGFSDGEGVEQRDFEARARLVCWLRSDFASRYHRFIFLRHLKAQRELILLVESLSGVPWAPENNLYGAIRTSEEAAQIRSEDDRLDRVLLRSKERHYEIEKDDTRGGALPEHKEIVEGGPFGTRLGTIPGQPRLRTG